MLRHVCGLRVTPVNYKVNVWTDDHCWWLIFHSCSCWEGDIFSSFHKSRAKGQRTRDEREDITDETPHSDLRFLTPDESCVLGTRLRPELAPKDQKQPHGTKIMYPQSTGAASRAIKPIFMRPEYRTNDTVLSRYWTGHLHGIVRFITNTVYRTAVGMLQDLKL